MFMSETQVMTSVADARFETEVSNAVQEADRIAANNLAPMFVVRTKNGAIGVWNEFKMNVASDDILETVYSTEEGFLFSAVA